MVVRRFAPLLAAAVLLAAPGTGAAEPGAASSKAKSRVCGTKLLYGKTVTIRERGRVISCARVSRITAGGCRDRRRWACFSVHPPGPVLIWFREKDRFKGRTSLLIEGLRWPCAEAAVTPEMWTTAQTVGQSKFPTYEQVLADDLIRCGQLTGLTRDGVIALLGPADVETHNRGITYLDYEIGPERDSFFQIDSEVLSVQIGRTGLFIRADIYQS